MRVILDIDDELLSEAKRLAIQSECSLDTLVADALRTMFAMQHQLHSKAVRD